MRQPSRHAVRLVCKPAGRGNWNPIELTVHGGTHEEMQAARGAFGPGLPMRANRRFCVRCVRNVEPAGGTVYAGMFTCALHPPKKPAQ